MESEDNDVSLQERGIFSDDGDSLCSEVSPNSSQDVTYSRPCYETKGNGSPPSSSSLTRRKPGLKTNKNNKNKGKSSSHYATTTTLPQTRSYENGNLQETYNSGTDDEISNEINEILKKTTTYLYFGFLFIIFIIIFQIGIFLYIMNQNSTQFETILTENHDLTLKTLEEISEMKLNILYEIKTIKIQNSFELDELKDIIENKFKLLYEQNKQYQINNGESDGIQNIEPYKVQTEIYKEFESKPIQIQIEDNGYDDDKISNFRKKFQIFKKEIKSPQFRETWVELYSGIEHTLIESTSSRPASIIFLVPPTIMDYDKFISCFVKKFAFIINTVHGKESAPIKEIDLSYWNKFSTLTDIHNDLEIYLQNIGKIILIHDIDKIIRKDHLMIFHSFCDNFMAFDKTATFIFIIRVPQYIIDKYGWTSFSGIKISNYILDNAWESIIPLDTRAALISRIAVNIISLKGNDICL